MLKTINHKNSQSENIRRLSANNNHKEYNLDPFEKLIKENQLYKNKNLMLSEKVNELNILNQQLKNKYEKDINDINNKYNEIIRNLKIKIDNNEL